MAGCGQDKSAGAGSSYSYNRDDLGYLSDGEVWFFRDNTQVTPFPSSPLLEPSKPHAISRN